MGDDVYRVLGTTSWTVVERAPQRTLVPADPGDSITVSHGVLQGASCPLAVVRTEARP